MKSQTFQPLLTPSLMETLRKGVESGLWTLEQLDRPTTSWVSNTRVDKRFFKDGYQGIQHRNLLRHSGYTPDPNTAATGRNPANDLTTTNDDLPF